MRTDREMKRDKKYHNTVITRGISSWDATVCLQFSDGGIDGAGINDKFPEKSLFYKVVQFCLEHEQKECLTGFKFTLKKTRIVLANTLLHYCNF